jgi:hypothetical protein
MIHRPPIAERGDRYSPVCAFSMSGSRADAGDWPRVCRCRGVRSCSTFIQSAAGLRGQDSEPSVKHQHCLRLFNYR